MRSTSPASHIPPTNLERQSSRPGSRAGSRRGSFKAPASSSRVRLDLPESPPPLPPRTSRHLRHMGNLQLGSRSTPDLGAARRAQQQRSKAAAAENGAETTGKKRGRVSLGMLFQSRHRSVSTPVAKPEDEQEELPQPPPLAAPAPAAKSAPTTPITPTFRCPSCEALDVTTPRAVSRRPSNGAGHGRQLSRGPLHSTVRTGDTFPARGPPNALYNSVYRYGHSASMTSMHGSHPPLGMSLSQTSLIHSRSSLHNLSHTSLHNSSRTSLHNNNSRTNLGLGYASTHPYNASKASLSLSQTSLILPDNGRNQLLSKDHYHLRFAATYIINLIAPSLRAANFQKSERNMEIKRITEDRLAMLQRMERTWGSSWSEAAADLLNDTPSDLPLEAQEAKLRACNITATAKARERKVFVNALADGIIFCFLFNRLFHMQPSRIQRVKVPKDETRIKANLDRFLSSCREVGVPESEMFGIGDLDEHSPEGLALVARTVLVLAQMSGPTNVPRVRIGLRLSSKSETSQSTPMAQSPSHSGTTSTTPSQRSSGVTCVAPRTLSDRLQRSGSSDLLDRLHTENGTSSGTLVSTTTATAGRTATNNEGFVQNISTTANPPLSPVGAAVSVPPIPALPDVLPQASNAPPIPTISTPMPAPVPVASTARPQLMRAGNRVQVSFASDSSSPRVSSYEWNSSVSSAHSSSYLTPLQERSPPHGVSDRMPHERTPPERSQLQERERTPSLVSASSHVPSSYSRSSMSASGFNGSGANMIGEDFHHALDEATIVDSSLQPESSTSCNSPEARNVSEHTLQEARRKIIGTLLSSTEDLSLANHIQDDARGFALSQSLAALEGAVRPPLNPRRSDSPRLRPVSRAARTQSTELEQRVGDEAAHMPLRPMSELPPRPRIRRLSVNGKIYVPRRPQSPASPSLSMHGGMVQSPDALVDSGAEFGVSRIMTKDMTKEKRRRSADCAPPGITSGRIMNLNNHSMVNLPSRRTPTLSHNNNNSRDSMVHGSLQVLEFNNSEGHESMRYQLGNCIGRGQFGSVYRSLSLSTGQMVAIKRIRLSGVKEKEVRDVMREVEVLQRLSHPGIVKYEGMSRDDQFLNIVLEFVENGSLGQTLKAFGKFNERLVASYVAKILEGLHYLHSQGVVHCDLKAANILSTKNGNIKLSDFGVSLNMRAVENFAERASIGRTVLKNEIAGTPNWMAPEVIKLSGASPASDIWSLGCTIIELITGKPPYSDVPNSMTVLFRIVEDPMPPMPETSLELQDFLKLCFVKEPALRPTAAMLFEHEWVRAGRGDLLVRPQDSLPFLRRLSQEPAHHRIESQRVFSSNAQAGAPSAAASMIDLGDTAHLAQMSMVSLHSHVVHHKDDREGSPEAVSSGKAHALVKTSFAKPITCHVCLQCLKKQALLCQTCGLITHTKCAARAHPKCDVREQLALLAHHQDWSVPTGESSPDQPTGLGISSLPARLFSRNKSKSSLVVPSNSSFDSRRRYSSGGSTPGHNSPGVEPASLRSRLSDHSDETGTGPRHPNPSTSLLRIDEDATYDRPVIRVNAPEDRKMPAPVENPGKRRSVRGEKKGDCVVQ
ncbi:hypothetical protein CcaverHIS641_0703120 [Cutaneotrichosporon cavernicola]|nr:hypothetical protein CcaverHIS641_0703120 [Cutaneotrichosporon cavernicola]